MVERPLFVGYVFIRYSFKTKLPLLTTPGALRLLGDSINDTVSSDEIERIRQGLASGCLLRPHFELPVGTRVRVRRGVFEGAEGVVAEVRQRCKVVMTLSSVRQCFSLEVDREDVEVVRSAGLQDDSIESRRLAIA
jgi:transcription antitermination factor NusG